MSGENIPAGGNPGQSDTGAADKKTAPDPDNQINWVGQVVAGVLLVAFNFWAIYFLLAFWPDQMPGPSETSNNSYYHCRLFHMKLLTHTELAVIAAEDSLSFLATFPPKPYPSHVDHPPTGPGPVTPAKDSLDSIEKTKHAADTISNYTLNNNRAHRQHYRLIHLNTILLILVALAGFLGNMIHISTSFISFVGAKEFKKSWLLWYCVKPFTAAGLAVIVYFLIRAGFLNYSDNGNNLNLFGILSLAAFAGLFTDKATQKLEEIFEVIFKPKDDRPDKLGASNIQVTGLSPDKLDKTSPNKIVITGTGFDKKKPVVKMGDDTIIDAVFQATSISFSYTAQAPPPPNSPGIKLSLLDDQGKELYTKMIPLTP